ncbi:PTS sugar transporter subunit IIC [Companilactobacillus hulinensis]|uniref:PTS sugar transporter subunit IIC n=1 Tax=Companilactobacillus hulinensis TaxID=2486007 RepID=UPI000F76ABF8|nr:PTS transporter subunit EIIC [Companilactobacillus hulinensis]
MKNEKESGLNSFIEKKLLPVAAKLGSLKPLIAIRDGISLAMPLIIVGSVFLILTNFPVESWTNWLNSTSFHGVSIADVFNKITNGSFGLLGMISSFGIASSFAEQYETDGKSAGVIAVGSFFVVTPSIMTSGKTTLEGMPYGYMGSKGLFIAIILGLITGWIFQWFINHNIQIVLPDTVPPAVAKSFSALIPGAVIVTLFGALYAIFAWTDLGNIHEILLIVLGGPLGLLGNTLGGTVIAVMLNSLFWFVGIHGGNVVNPIISPIWLMNADANRVLLKAGNLDLEHGGHIITAPFIDSFVFIGGSGATLGLVLCIGLLVIMKKASKESEILAPLTIMPGIFKINEPAMFGLPIVLNTTLIIPFVLAPVMNAIIAYVAMSLKIVPLTVGVVMPWTTPPFVSGFLATNSWVGSALQLLLIVLDMAIYMPFMITMNRQQLIREQKID